MSKGTRVQPKPRGPANRPGPVETVSARWLVRAFALTVAVAAVCGYLTFCALFLQGQWQLVLHPSRADTLPATIGGRPFDRVRFGANAAGVPQLAGVWLAADPGGRYRHLTILYLGGGDGSLASATEVPGQLRELGLNVLAFDYRGYGASAAEHPTQARMEEDSEAALHYLETVRHLPEGRILPYGRGVGATLAARLAAGHRALPVVVLDAPRFGITAEVARDPRVRLLPVRLLFRERFALEPMLQGLATPKLIVTRGRVEAPQVLAAADPKTTVALPETEAGDFPHVLARFLDQYAPPTPPAVLLPTQP